MMITRLLPGVLTLLMGLVRVALAQTGTPVLPYTPLDVATPDGVHIAAQVWGVANGPEILFKHGFGQPHLTWERQVGSDLAHEFKMVTYDLRGHGDSGKPLDRASYQEGQRWLMR